MTPLERVALMDRGRILLVKDYRSGRRGHHYDPIRRSIAEGPLLEQVPPFHMASYGTYSRARCVRLTPTGLRKSRWIRGHHSMPGTHSSPDLKERQRYGGGRRGSLNDTGTLLPRS